MPGRGISTPRRISRTVWTTIRTGPAPVSSPLCRRSTCEPMDFRGPGPGERTRGRRRSHRREWNVASVRARRRFRGGQEGVCVECGTRLPYRILEVEHFLLRLQSEQVPAHHGRVEGNASNYCPADPGGAVGVSRAGQEIGQSDTMVKPRELPGYLKAVGVRLERFDALTCDDACRTLRAGGRMTMAVMARAREIRTRLAGGLTERANRGPASRSDPAAWLHPGSSGNVSCASGPPMRAEPFRRTA